MLSNHPITNLTDQFQPSNKIAMENQPNPQIIPIRNHIRIPKKPSLPFIQKNI